MSFNRGRFVLMAIACVIALGSLGLYQLDPDGFFARPLDNLYHLVQLFAVEGDWTNGQDLPLALQLARFLAPVVTVASLVLIFAEGMWTTLINARARFCRDHVVIVGLSDAAMVLVRDCASRGMRVVAIDQSADNRYLTECRRLRIPVLIGDGKHLDTLRRARISDAASLLSFIPNDDDNVELSLRIQEVLEGAGFAPGSAAQGQHPGKGHAAGERLESYPKFFEYPQKMEVRFFNLDEQAARALFSSYHPDVYADALGVNVVHIVILGYGTMGKHVASTALKQAHYGNNKPLMVTVLDPDAERAKEVFARQCPDISLAANVRFVETELAPEVLRSNSQRLLLDDATMFVCCHGSDSDNLIMSLAMRQLALLAVLPNAPIFVALRNSRGLARLVESGEGNPEIPDGLYPFGMVEQLMRVDRMINERTDYLAVAVHQGFLDGLGDGLRTQASHRPWGMLPEVFRNYNRAQADHMLVKLRAVGCNISRERNDTHFTEEETARLAQMEKVRWNAERASLGWTYAETRSDLAMVHPMLKPWPELTAQERAYDLKVTRDIPDMLQEQLGRGVAREIVIGVTGHRAERTMPVEAQLKEAIVAELRDIKTTYPKCTFAVLSALADGSDRLVASLAMEHLDAKLFAPLPLPYELYKRSFGGGAHLSNEESTAEFQRFVGRSERYYEMPLRFGGVRELEREDDVGRSAMEHQFALAGAYIVSRSHELIAVWDGQPSRGVGGTADVVAWRMRGYVPDDYQFPGHFFSPVPMTAPRIVPLPGSEAAPAEPGQQSSAG